MRMAGIRLDRRRVVAIGAAALGSVAAGCDRFAETPAGQSILEAAETITYRAQRMLIGADELAREFGESDISSSFRSNGTSDPDDESYRRLASANFVDWRLRVDGLVEHPLDLSLADLRALPARTQITRHDCVEGWSCIGKWTGPPLSEVLVRAGARAQAKFVVFHCADTMERTLDDRAVRYYESVDLVDALHPQTILAYEMNGKPLPIPHGAPLRLRVERQLGYKMAKYLVRIELVDSFKSIGDGKGGYWEDRGYEWYAGI
jgi:DMSO/TMAO reductase YedYZ molybdopterin-dependent catalytic subunit